MSIAATALLAGVLVSPAPRLVLRTAELVPESGALACRVENGSPRTRSVRVEALDRAGEAILDSGAFPLVAGAVFLTSGGPGARSCRFTLAGGLDGVRARGLLLGPEGEAPRELLPARVTEGEAR